MEEDVGHVIKVVMRAFIVLCLLTIIFHVWVGIFELTIYKERTENVQATVLSVSEKKKSVVTVVGKVPVITHRRTYNVSYVFEVDGISYSGCENIGYSVAKDSIINVRYNPDNPTENDIK